jgi:hypothetical protein
MASAVVLGAAVSIFAGKTVAVIVACVVIAFDVFELAVRIAQRRRRSRASA